MSNEPIKQETLNTIIADQYRWNFDVPAAGLYLVTIVARCKSWSQNLFKLRFSDDDLAVKIDDFLFFELKGKKREFNSVGSWNGNELKNNSKAVLFVLPLKAGQHSLTFFADQSPFVESTEVAALDTKVLDYNLSVPANVRALDIVFKNAKVEDLAVINNKKETTEFVIQNAKSGVSSSPLQQFGEPGIVLIKAKITIGPEKIGWVKLYKDITDQTVINLRSEPHTTAAILGDLIDGDELEIISEREKGDQFYYYSNIWHKVKFKGQIGFVLSSYVELQGQEREKIIDLIKTKCSQKEKEYDVDANIMLAIAGVESHYKPYAVAIDERGKEARGVFQLQEAAANEVKIADRFDFYQNVDGGVRYYKKIEKLVVGRGHVLEQRLLAWHNGYTNVVNGKLKYSDFPPTSATSKFIVNVLANIKKRDWTRIILAPVIVFVIWFSFNLGRDWFPVAYPVPVAMGNAGVEEVKAAEQPVGAPDQTLEGKSLVFEVALHGIKKIIVRENRSPEDWPITRVVYWPDSGVAVNETLDGWLVEAGWKDGFFYIERQSGMHYAPTAVYSVKNGHLEKVKIVEKNGRVRDEFDAPVFSFDAYEKVVRERQYDAADVPRNVYIEELKDYRYFPPDNTFYEFRRIREETDMGNG